MTLEFDGIQFSYDERTLLSGIYMKCETGKITGLLGRNGVGKSTLLKLAFGSLQTELISVRINQKTISQPSFTSRQIAYLPQDSFIPDGFTLKKILEFYKISEDKICQSFPELEEDILKSADQLSGGRLRLFEALLILNSSAPFCLLDEPFTGLTPVWIERLVDYINQVKETKGIILSDHLYRYVTALSNKLYLLTNGKTYLINNESELIQRGYLPDQE